MIDAPSSHQSDPDDIRTSITILIEAEEDLTVVDDPPEMRNLWDIDKLGAGGGKTWNVVIDEAEGADIES